MGGGSPGDGNVIERVKSEYALLSKFYKKYPEVKYFAAPTHDKQSFGGVYNQVHPAAAFLKKQSDLIRKGYTEEKAFQIVEEELGKFLN